MNKNCYNRRNKYRANACSVMGNNCRALSGQKEGVIYEP